VISMAKKLTKGQKNRLTDAIEAKMFKLFENKACTMADLDKISKMMDRCRVRIRSS